MVTVELSYCIFHMNTNVAHLLCVDLLVHYIDTFWFCIKRTSVLWQKNISEANLAFA